MEKGKNIVAYVALSTYFFVIGSAVTLNSVTKQADKHSELLEIQKSVNELRYYVNEDVFNGNLREDLYEFYTEELYNIEQSIKELRNE